MFTFPEKLPRWAVALLIMASMAFLFASLWISDMINQWYASGGGIFK